ncbi:MAG: hypothetical protein PVF49_07355, partial [Anaerolineales bacterium]
MGTLALDPRIETAIGRLDGLLEDGYPIKRRALAILLLEGDEEMTRLVAQRQPDHQTAVEAIIHTTQDQFEDPLAYVIHRNRMQHAHSVVEQALHTKPGTSVDWGEKLSRLTIHPLSGGLISILVLLALYWWVGVIGAQTMVNWLEG